MSADRPALVQGLDPHRIVEIIVETGSGGRRGSGYRISVEAVLTAAHVVANAAVIAVRCDADRPGEWSTPATVTWMDKESDLAVFTSCRRQERPPSSSRPGSGASTMTDTA